jgi:C4-dicarboxylate-specific signal transduction histidine kinase
VASAEWRVTHVATPGLRESWHDMRQPVASMFTLAAAALAEPGLPQPARVRLEQIVEQAAWMADLIQHSLPNGEADVPGACATDLLRVVSEAVAAERVTWLGEMKVLSPPEPVFTAVHFVVLRRIVANLLGNATRAAGPSGTVTIEIGLDRCSVMLAIEDTGPGFGKIERGLGLGLAAVARGIATYGGRLERECGTGGGVRVNLWLPRGWPASTTSPVTRAG